MIRHGHVHWESEIHAARWREPDTQTFDVMCQEGSVLAASVVAITHQPLTCVACRAWARRTILSR